MDNKEQKSLEEWMLEKGFTQRSLGRAAGVSHSIINLVIDGTRDSIRSDTRGKIARALGVEIRQVREFAQMIDEQLGKENRQPPTRLLAGTTTIAATALAAAVN